MIASRVLPVTLALAAAVGLRAQSSDYPLAINLPTAERMQYWDIGAAFTHRFVTPVKDHGKDLYGVDGYAYPGFGLAFGFKPIKGLNVLIYRTPDNKTFTFGFQQQLADAEYVRSAVRVERFDEVVPHQTTPAGEVGLTGATVQVPTEFFLGDLIITLVPTYVTATATRSLDLTTNPATVLPSDKQKKGLFNMGIGLRYGFTEKFSAMGEYYPKPSRLPNNHIVGQINGEDYGYQAGFAFGVSYKTFKHRFTVIGTNTTGTTASQVLSGDHGGGPRPSGQWSLGFNIVRVF